MAYQKWRSHRSKGKEIDQPVTWWNVEREVMETVGVNAPDTCVEQLAGSGDGDRYTYL
jgi:hypothetical protein